MLVNSSASAHDAMQRLAKANTVGEYSRTLSDVSKWSKSVSSIDEAQLDAMRKHNNKQPSRTHSSSMTGTTGRPAHDSRHEM